jgi:hypothetical protein
MNAKRVFYLLLATDGKVDTFCTYRRRARMLGTRPLQILTTVFAEHQALVKYCRECRSASDTPQLPTLAAAYLKLLASPNGNDILEEVLVKATGREPKDDAAKHGADSKDGELEAKPMKTAYNAHISDDTPASLLRHQTIPYICLAEWTKDGVELLWTITTSYRIFDAARYRGILATFGADHRLVPELPTTLAERRAALEALVVVRERFIKERNIPRYVRSNPLPVEALAALGPGQYTVWCDPKLATSRAKAHKILWSLWQKQQQQQEAGTYELDHTFVAETEAIRQYFSAT